MLNADASVPPNYRRVKRQNTTYNLLRKKVLLLHPARQRYFFAIMRGREWTDANLNEALAEARRTKPSKCDEELGWYSRYGDQ